jgi:signal transduction histidine kinase
MARLQSFLLTGDRTIRLRYNAAIAEEDSLYNDLGDLVRVMDLDVRERLARLSSESTRWRLGHLSVFAEVIGPEAGDALWAQIQGEYEELQSATRELERVIKVEVDQGRRDTQWWRTMQTWIMIGLAILALGSLLVIARVSWRVRRLVTEAEKREDALRRTVEQRDEVVSIVSHDLRNPLGVVVGAADTLIELPLDREEREKQVTIIARSASRMSRLIEDLLDVARIEAGAFVVRPSAEEPISVLEEVRDMFEVQADEAQVSLTVGPVSDVLVHMDHDRVVQALANLVDNALRFTPEGGMITLSGEALDKGTVSLSVSDTGVGLAQDALDNLFSRFWQAEGDRKGRAGLGLTIVKGVIEAHGGEVRVESDPGIGSTFHLVLYRA